MRFYKKSICIYKRPATRETFITSIDPFTVLTTIFGWDKLAKIRYHGRDESASKSATLARPRLKAKTKLHIVAELFN